MIFSVSSISLATKTTAIVSFFLFMFAFHINVHIHAQGLQGVGTTSALALERILVSSLCQGVQELHSETAV